MKILLLILISLSCYAQNYPKLFAEKLVEDRFIISNDSLILLAQKKIGIPLSILTSEQKEQIKTMYLYDAKIKEINIQYYSNLLKTDIGDNSYISEQQEVDGFFIIRQDRINNIDRNYFKKLTKIRKSLTQVQNNYFYLFQFKQVESDSTYLINAFNQNLVYYLVPYRYSEEQLNNYLENPESVPRWIFSITKTIGKR